MLMKVETSGFAIRKYFKGVRVVLVDIRACVRVGDGPIVERLDRLVTLFFQCV